jgi:molybdopterin/thiamine biosynthesis adenylyltransferase
MVLRLRGTATETIKNIVLAGIGKLVVVDDEEVSEEDLGAGFFFRDEDVGKKVKYKYLGQYGELLDLIGLLFRELMQLRPECRASTPS